ncbi:MAG: flagellar biosynthesis protein FlhB [Desulfobacteraceae bacterium]|jgi:flagellar biosynthetic protein FlhB
MADNDQEKTEQPTGKKLSKAREKGQVAHSREIPSVMILLGSLGVFMLAGSWMFSELTNITSLLLKDSASITWTITTLTRLGWQLFGQVIRLLAPLFLVIILLGIAGNVVQIGFLFTTEPLQLKFSKLNPISGFKRFFSLRSIVELAKSLLKLALIGWVAYITVRKEMDAIPLLLQAEVPQILAFIGKVAVRIIWFTVLVLMLLAALDFFYQRWQHEKELRMTKQEKKDEFKQTEGDPAVKARIRSAQKEMMRRRMMEAIPQATVVITNPTHLAVALRFENNYQAPVVVAKGAGVLAEKIRSIAKAHDIPIVEQKPLAQALYKTVEIGHFIPAELYRAVAEVLAYVYRLKGLVHTH